jgi:hypothetical protein
MGIQTTRDNIMQDVWGNNHGIINGAMVTEEGYDFNGSSSFVSVANSPTFDVNEFTVAIFVYPRNVNAIMTLISRGYKGGPGYERGWLLHAESNLLRWHVADGNLDAVESIYSWTVPNKWYFIVGVKDSNKVYLYVDGDLKDSDAISGYTNYSYQIDIGRLTYSKKFYLDGVVGVALFYKRALSPSEIQTLYNLGRGITHKGYPRSPTYP